MEKVSKINSPVVLSEGRIENFPDLLNLILEYAVFFRWIYFKNRPRGNLFLFRSLLVVSFFASIYFLAFGDFGLVLEGIEIDPVVAFAGAVVFGYWNMLNVFHRKSEACSQIYLEMIKNANSGKDINSRLLCNTLCLELLTLDLWAHRMYKSLFARNLSRAVDVAYAKKMSQIGAVQLPENKSHFLDFINKGQLQAKDARTLLDSYQDVLLEEVKVFSHKEAAA